jgi:hypothetical protein
MINNHLLVVKIHLSTNMQILHRLMRRRAAAAKWRSGKLLLSATLPSHTGPVTCIATLQHIIATGSSDGSAAVWDMQQGSLLHLLRHSEPVPAPVLAAALPSVSLCVTATALSACLWRQGKAIRRFNVTPVSGNIARVLLDCRIYAQRCLRHALAALPDLHLCSMCYTKSYQTALQSALQCVTALTEHAAYMCVPPTQLHN